LRQTEFYPPACDSPLLPFKSRESLGMEKPSYCQILGARRETGRLPLTSPPQLRTHPLARSGPGFLGHLQIVGIFQCKQLSASELRPRVGQHMSGFPNHFRCDVGVSVRLCVDVNSVVEAVQTSVI
jgi:hypothetical protein